MFLINLHVKLDIMSIFLNSDAAFKNLLALFIVDFLVISLVDSFMCLNISLLALLILKFSSSGLILINLQPIFFLILFAFLFHG